MQCLGCYRNSIHATILLYLHAILSTLLCYVGKFLVDTNYVGCLALVKGAYLMMMMMVMMRVDAAYI